MQTKLFAEGIRQLLEVAKAKRACVTYMEMKPKYCHRRFVSANLERKGVKVIHIIEKGQTRLLI